MSARTTAAHEGVQPALYMIAAMVLMPHVSLEDEARRLKAAQALRPAVWMDRAELRLLMANIDDLAALHPITAADWQAKREAHSRAREELRATLEWAMRERVGKYFTDLYEAGLLLRPDHPSRVAAE